MGLSSMSPWGVVSFLLRRGAMVAGALVAQYFVFRFLWKSLPAAHRKKTASKVLFIGLFLVANVPFLFVFVDWALGILLPRGLFRAVIFPFTAIQMAGLFCLLFLFSVFAGGGLSRLMQRLRRWGEEKGGADQAPGEGDEKAEAAVEPRHPGRRKVLTMATTGVGAGALLVAARGIGHGAGDPIIREVRIPISGLDPRLDGFRIAQITDIHVGYFYDRPRLENLARLTNSLRPHLVTLTGDQVHGFHPGFINDLVMGLKGLKAPTGVAAIMGNHDRRPGRERVVSAMSGVGWEVLRDRLISLRWRGATLNLAGIKDWADRPDMGKALEGRDPQCPTILLSHRPEAFDEAVGREVDLVLAGHTHGGQVAPLGFNVAKLALPYVHGLYSVGKTRMYVCAGVGLTGPPPPYRGSPRTGSCRSGQDLINIPGLTPSS